jgi:hypothetical protein
MHVLQGFIKIIPCVSSLLTKIVILCCTPNPSVCVCINLPLRSFFGVHVPEALTWTFMQVVVVSTAVAALGMLSKGLGKEFSFCARCVP